MQERCPTINQVKQKSIYDWFKHHNKHKILKTLMFFYEEKSKEERNRNTKNRKNKMTNNM